MNNFKKLALASAIAALPVAGFSMEALEDEAMGEVTGQDGITISITGMNIGTVRISDGDGILSAAGDSGAIFIEDMDMSGMGATTIVVDADDDTLQAAITVGSGTMALGNIGVGAATGTAATTSGIISLGSISMGDLSLNLQLGTEDQSHLIVLNGSVSGGISLTGFAINDIDSGGSISMNLGVDDGGAGTDLTLQGNINVVNEGLQIANLAGAAGLDVTLGALKLGTSTNAAIGDVSIMGLQPGTIVISGHLTN